MAALETKTLVIDNFRGDMTGYLYGDINSGRSLYQIVSGQNPFIKPGQLTWSEAPTQIDPNGSVITDLIMDGKERVESGVLYVYAIGHTGRLYKIQVNDPTTYNPDYDNPVLVTTLAINSPTFTRGGFMDFFGLSGAEQIYIGHDKGVTKINFDGTGEAFVGSLGSWTQSVPRPLKQFIGSLFVGNGINIAQIDSSLSVATYAKLSPGFPNDTQIRDIDLSSDGTYLETVVSRLSLFDVTSSAQQTTSNANSESYIFKWNGTDNSYTAFDTFPSFSLNANIMFQGYQYTFGSDQYGSAIFNPNEKILSLAETPYIAPNSIRSTGNLLTFFAPLYFEGTMSNTFYTRGSFDYEIGNPQISGTGYWSPFFQVATSPETDVIACPFQLSVSNIGVGSSSNGYAENVFGTSKIYFSALETSGTPTTKYRLYKWRIVTSLQVSSSTNAFVGAVYQTQSQMFSKKISVKQVRIYGEPWATGNSFTIDLIGSTGTFGPIANGSSTFTAGTNLTVGDDFAWYDPAIDSTYCLGLSITNNGTINHTINKIEVDYTDGGK